MNAVYARVGAAGMISVMRKRTISGEQWWKIISEQPASGMSIAAFCRRRLLSEASFFAWRRKLTGAAHFAEVQIAPEPAPESSGIEVRLSNGRSVVVRAGFDRRTLLDLLETLEHGGREASHDEVGR